MKGNVLKRKYLIGEFSELTGVSKRMLRHYDELGLLTPAEIDGATAYRYYVEDQHDTVSIIRTLNRLGFSLKETQEIIDGSVDSSYFVDLLKAKEAEFRISIDEDTGILLRLQRIIDHIHLQGNNCVSLPGVLLSFKSNVYENRRLPLEKSKNVLEKMKSLPSADVFYEQIENTVNKECKDAQIWTFISFDIDKFLRVNDECGYDTGDKVIYSIMNTILKEFSPSTGKSLASRLGGDEMGIFIKSMDKSELIEKLNNVIREINSIDFGSLGCSFPITTSAGVYRTKIVSHRNDLRHHSTKALLEAKRLGGNQFFLIEDNA